MIAFIRRRHASVIGLLVGGLVGLAAAAGYGGTSAWLCSGIRNCPVSWEPFVLVSSIIFVVLTVTGIFAAMVVARLYKIFDTATGGEAAYSSQGGRGSGRTAGIDGGSGSV
ncbi:MAG: hypothetical protein O3B95_08205 [Chloroflexi bacterium]|nr:hypothetical protein [Chloroflexota bacterium]